MKRALTALILAILLTVAGCSGGGSEAADGGSGSIGLSAGGAQDANNFRENIEHGYVPQPTSLQYEGLFHDYYFDTGQQDACEKLFCPSYSYAITRDPLSGEVEEYLTVGLNSGLNSSQFERKKLNLVVVLDTSGSMGSPMSQYYYDGNRQTPESEKGKSKMRTATDALTTLTGHLRPGDRFGLVTYSDDAQVVHEMQPVSETDMDRLHERIRSIDADGGTNLAAGMDTAEKMVEPYANANSTEYETRIIYLTDAMPNLGDTSGESLGSRLDTNADRGIFSTFIGIGVDFNTRLVETINSVHGANYYTVDSTQEFEDRMDEGFAYMVTPLVFDLEVTLNASGYDIEQVYGSPTADESTGRILSVNTLFPSRTKNNTTEGGVVLLKLNRTEPGAKKLTLTASYENRRGERTSTTTEVRVAENGPEYFESPGVRKAVLLARYGELMRNWMIYERARVAGVTPEESTRGIEHTTLGKWEQQLVPLRVSPAYRERFEQFSEYFSAERTALGDESLNRELTILRTLSDYEGRAPETENVDGTETDGSATA